MDNAIVISDKDELVMSLIHYFVTEKDYTPIVVKGVKDEIWLENNEAIYKIIRINSQHIHNDEQLNFDFWKTKSIVKQIKKKTLSFSVNTLNIFTDLSDQVNLHNTKNIDVLRIEEMKDIDSNKELLEIFPDITSKMVKDKRGLDFLVNVTSDLNHKTEENNKIYEQTFKPKKIIITKVIILVCILMYLVSCILDRNYLDISALTLYKLGGNNKGALQNFELYRLIVHMFLHGGIIHLLANMYSLSIVGKQVETFFGRAKFIIIYLVSGICGGLLSAVLHDGVSIGASGAIFGLLGSILYFGYHYRVYLGESFKRDILPVIFLNLFIGFVTPGIDNACHIGGLVAGYLISMTLGIYGKSNKKDRINGIICLVVLLAFLVYLLFR